MAESLRKQGHIADICALTELRLDWLDRYHVISVLRPKPSKVLDEVLKFCHRYEIRTVADVDDLVFVPRYAKLSPSALNQQATELSIRGRFEANLSAMLGFDEITVSTEPLAVHWQEQTGRTNVCVVPNGLSSQWLKTKVKPTSESISAIRTITYLPGSNSHDKDFSEITDILAETLHRHKHVKLNIVGTLNTNDRLFPRQQVTRSSWVDYYKLPQIITSSSVTLAPLVSSPFTYAKSHIKFIESAAFGTPAICSPNQDICRHRSSGLFIAKCADDWRTALHQVLENPMSDRELKAMQDQIRTIATAERSARILAGRWQSSRFESLQNVA